MRSPALLCFSCSCFPGSHFPPRIPLLHAQGVTTISLAMG